MVLVFTFFIIIIVLMLIFLISTLKIDIKKIEITNEIPNTPLIKEFEIVIGIYVFDKIKLYSKTIKKQDIEKMKNSKSLTKLKNGIMTKDILKNKKSNIKMDLDILKGINPNLQQINLELKLGTEDVVLTSFLICIISILISMVLSKAIQIYDEENYKYKIIPNYNNQNSIKIILSSIIEIKLVNIINILFKLLVRGDVNDK